MDWPFRLTKLPERSCHASEPGESAINQFFKYFDLVDIFKRFDSLHADPTQYMSQLASFSQVEQQVQTNTSLSAMLTSSSLSQADSVIGKSVTSADGSSSGTIASVTIGANGAATATTTTGTQISLVNGITISNPTTTPASSSSS
jgi:hypothetical protein